MKETHDRYWWRFGDEKQSSSFTGDLAGKYLFFCSRQQPLVDLARNEITNHGFDIAKVSQKATTGDFVCCLYWHDDSRKHELAERYKDELDIKYRWWKSNEDTRAGKYSEQFLAAKDLEAQFGPCRIEDPHWDFADDPMWDDAFNCFHD